MKSNSKFYYSKIEDEIIVNSIMEDFKERQQQRKPYELAWELNMNFFFGNQYSYISNNGEILDNEKNYYWENREVYNHIAPIIESRIAKLIKIKPDLIVKSNTTSDEDTYTAKLTQSIINASLNNNNFNNTLLNLIYWSEITGTSFLRFDWDTFAGDIVGKVNLETIKNGDLKISLCSPFEIYPDSNSNIEISECSSIIHARALPVKLVNEKWKQDFIGEDIDILELDNNSFLSNISGRSNITKILHSNKSNHVLLIERFEKPTINNPDGKYTIICQNKLLFDGKLPIQTDNINCIYPFIKLVSSKQIGCFWGISPIERCIPIQRAYNSIKNRKHEFISRLTSGVLLVEDGSIDIDDIEDEGLAPGKIIVYRNGSKEPTFLNPGSLPSELEKEETLLLSEINNMCCVSDITTSSSIPSSVSSGSALSLLISQDDSRLSLTATNIKTLLKLTGSMILYFYKTFASNIRLNKFVNQKGNLEIHYWTKSDIHSDVLIDVDNELEESINEKRKLILDLYSNGLLLDDNGKISYNNKLKILELFGLNNYNTFDNTDELHRQKAIKENNEIIKLNPPLEIDNHQIHINEHTKFIISFEDDEKINDELINKLIKHIQEHKKYLKEE